MSGYQAIPMTQDGQIAGPPIEIDAFDDFDALTKARKQMDGHDIQVRQGDRVVALLSRWDC